MKKFFYSCAVIGLISFSANAAVVVSDAGVYARMASELNEFKKQTEFLTSQLEELSSIKSNLEGNLGIGRGISRDLSRVKRRAQDMTRVFGNIEGVFDINEYDLSNMEDLQGVLDGMFKHEADILTRGRNTEAVQDIRQRAIKSAIEGSEAVIVEIQDSISKVDQLSTEIDNTETAKEAQDLTNRLLSEILHVQQQQLILIAQLTRAEQLAAYEGVSSDTPDAEGSARINNKSGFYMKGIESGKANEYFKDSKSNKWSCKVMNICD